MGWIGERVDSACSLVEYFLAFAYLGMREHENELAAMLRGQLEDGLLDVPTHHSEGRVDDIWGLNLAYLR